MAELVLGILLLAVIACAVLAWRLAEGPVNLGFLIPRVEAALNQSAGGPHVTIGGAALAWQGFRHGLESPLELVFGDVVVRGGDGAGVAAIPRAEVSLSTVQLLTGRIVPRRIVIEDPRLRIVRDREGRVALAFGRRREDEAPSPATADLIRQVLAALNAPPGSDRSTPARRFRELSQLRVLAVHGAELTVVDRALGATWYAPTANIALTRGAIGGLTGSALIALAVNGKQAELSLDIDLSDPANLTAEARLSPVNPSDIATIVPALAPLSLLRAPVQLTADLELGQGFSLRRFSLEADVSAGEIAVGGGAVPIRGAGLEIEAGSDSLVLRQAIIRLAGPNGAAGPVLKGNGTAKLTAGGAWRGEISVATSGVPMGDLARYWPPEIARGGRAWVTTNITAGTAEKAEATLGLAMAPDLQSVDLTDVTADVQATGLTVHWLRPMPPLTDGEATLSITGPDALTVRVQHAVDRGLVVNKGEVRIIGLEQRDQDATIDARVTGSLTAALGLLAEPRLNLLSQMKLPVNGAKGNTNTTLAISLPLLDKVTMRQVQVHAEAQLGNVHVPAIVGGHDLDGGTLDLTVANDGMKASGNVNIAGIPTRISYARDFRAGPSSQILERIQAEATVSAERLAAVGILDTQGLVRGPVQLAANLTEARNGAGHLDLRAGLTGASLALAPIGYVKPPGTEAQARAAIVLSGDQIASIKNFAVTGESLDVTGSASFASGSPLLVRIGRAVIGRTEAEGSVRFAGPGQPTTIVLSGTVLDLSAHFTHQARKGAEPGPSEAARPPSERGPPWVLDARFGRALLAEGNPLADCVLHAESDGRRITDARLTGNFLSGQPVSLVIASAGTGRTLRLSTKDAGALLAATDISSRVRGGWLTLDARYDDAVAGTPLSGTAEMMDFRVEKAPALGRLLQAMTLYGLAQVLEGPGLGFSKLIAPFRLADDRLDLTDARAFSPSLGLTLKGSVDLAARTADLSGTIVPAYFFNSLLGDIPLVGRIFSPEKGGGVFAATYTVNGPLDDPKVSVNPLAAVTPGFLRGLFSVFNGGGR